MIKLTYTEPVLYYYPTDIEQTESRESLTSSPALDQSEEPQVAWCENSEEERKEEEDEEGSVGNSVSMTPLLNLNSLMK